MAKRKLIPYEDLVKEWEKNPKFVRLRKEREPQFRFISQLIGARIKQNKTQTEVAEKAGLRQEAISALESMTREPRLSTALKYARAVNLKQLKI